MKNISAEDVMSENSSFKALSMEHFILLAHADCDNPCLNDKGTDYFLNCKNSRTFTDMSNLKKSYCISAERKCRRSKP